MTSQWDVTMKTINKKSDLVLRLYNSLKHMQPLDMLAVVCSWMPMDRLEECVKLQEGKK